MENPVFVKRACLNISDDCPFCHGSGERMVQLATPREQDAAERSRRAPWERLNAAVPALGMASA